MAKAKDMIAKAQEGLANGTVSQQEAAATLLEVSKMYEIIDKKHMQRLNILYAPES